MALLETIFVIIRTAGGALTGAKAIRDYINSKIDLEEALTDLTDKAFQKHKERIKHLCSEGSPQFSRKGFKRSLQNRSYEVTTRDELALDLIPLLNEAVGTPGLEQRDPIIFTPFYKIVIDAALKDMWKQFSDLDKGTAVDETLLSQNEEQITKISSVQIGIEGIDKKLAGIDNKFDSFYKDLAEVIKFAQSAWLQQYERLTDTAPPPKHIIGNQEHENPFLYGRAEDFNHNYNLLARLFYRSPEWNSIQNKTDNVFIEGGRGTGKSMLLRRLTAQATVAAKREEIERATFDDTNQDYFGVYVKLTRGYYDQYLSVDTVTSKVGSLIAQHDLNIEILDAFVDTVNWLINQNALSLSHENLTNLITQLNSLFPKAPKAKSLQELRSIVIDFEQEQIISYYRDKAFEIDANYQGSASPTVGFLRQLSKIFRQYLFPDSPVRLILLIDEFETLLNIQQVAINTVIKMRLNDLSTKIAVRKSGRKTSETFTENDPIQDPRDYINVQLDYDVDDSSYAELLRGIAAKRLEGAGYTNTKIDSYLLPIVEEIEPEKLEREFDEMWQSGNRKSETITDNFKQAYKTTAIYRVLSKTGKTKSFAGFDNYQLLSSGIISNFIELCKYTFYFALEDQHPLREDPGIPVSLQTAAAYKVSKRLFGTIEGNVPEVGVVLANLLNDLGNILRSRLLKHSSEPEANRLEIIDYNELSNGSYNLLKKVLDEAIIWSVFHELIPSESMRPKNYIRPPGTQLVINRIYAPALEISPRARWRVRLNLMDLENLINSSKRQETYQRLMNTIGADGSNQPSLFTS